MLEPLVMPKLSALDPMNLYGRGVQWFVVFRSTYNTFAELVLMLKPGAVWDFCGAKIPPDIVTLDSGCQAYLEEDESMQRAVVNYYVTLVGEWTLKLRSPPDESGS